MESRVQGLGSSVSGCLGVRVHGCEGVRVLEKL